MNEAPPDETARFVDASMLTRSDDTSVRLELAPLAIYPVRLRIAGVPFEVRFGAAGAAEVYRGRYRHMRANDAPSLVAYAVTRESGETYFWVDGGPLFCWNGFAITDRVVAFFADAVATTIFLRSIDGLIALHAAALTDGRSAAFIAGVSTAGKSTTAVACARRGLQLYSDEFALLRAGNVLAFPRALSVRREGLELLLADPSTGSPADAWLRENRGGDRESVGYDELFGAAAWPEPHPLRLAFAAVDKAATPSVRPIEPAQMLAHTMAFARQKLFGLGAVGALLAELQPVRCYELTLGTPSATANMIAGMLAST